MLEKQEPQVIVVESEEQQQPKDRERPKDGQMFASKKEAEDEEEQVNTLPGDANDLEAAICAALTQPSSTMITWLCLKQTGRSILHHHPQSRRRRLRRPRR